MGMKIITDDGRECQVLVYDGARGYVGNYGLMWPHQMGSQDFTINGFRFYKEQSEAYTRYHLGYFTSTSGSSPIGSGRVIIPVYIPETDRFYFAQAITRGGATGSHNSYRIIGTGTGFYLNTDYPTHESALVAAQLFVNDYSNPAAVVYTSDAKLSEGGPLGVSVTLLNPESDRVWTASRFYDAIDYVNGSMGYVSLANAKVIFGDHLVEQDDSGGDISNATITLTPNTFVYDGEAKTPNVTITLNGVQLTEGVDYIKTYENNINPGTAAVLVAGQGDYTGSQRVYFTISSGIDTNDIANATITLSPSMYYYDGTAKTPNVTVKMGAVQLTEGTDYIKTYENNINEGLASVLVAGQGNYTGSKRAYFSIYAATNPYDNLEPSGPSDTTPTYDYSSDAVGLPTLPDISMADVGLVRIYNPTKAQLNSLAQYLWTDTTFVDTLINHFKQIFESPMNAIIALNLLPCPVPNSGAQELKVMYIPTGVQMNVATNQFVDVDCGKVTIETVYGSALDYAPYTKASIFLPYVGQVSLNVDEIMGKVLRVHYRVDIVTGGCVALIDVDGTVMYQFSGHCAISMPLSGADFSNLIGALIQSAKAAATIAGGGAAAIAGAAEGATRYSGSRKSTPSLSAEMGQKIAAMDSDVMDFAGLTAKNIGNTVGAVMGAKPDISRTGTFSGNTGYLGVRRPYVILERPRLCNPQEYGRFNGYPSMQTVQLNNARGFTQVQQIQLTGISATGPELDELQTLLKQGVIL